MAETENLYAYPVLYNVSLHDYRGSERRAKAWRKVAASIGLSVVECKLKKEEGGNRLHHWPHRETLSFLDPHIRKRKRHSEADALEDAGGSDQESPEEQDPIDANASPALLTASVAPTNINGKIEEKEVLKICLKPVLDRTLDEDELFLLSYVPALKRLTPQKRAAVKMKIQQIMFDAEFKDA